jgi:hypothetical protein
MNAVRSGGVRQFTGLAWHGVYNAVVCITKSFRSKAAFCQKHGLHQQANTVKYPIREPRFANLPSGIGVPAQRSIWVR